MTHVPPTPTPEQADALGLLRAGERFVLVGHVRPDGDCLGAQGALARGLQALGKDVAIVNPDEPEARFDYLYAEGPYRVFDGEAVPPHDVCCLLDINELSRCGPLTEPLRAAPSKKVVIDHHPSEGAPWWDAAYMDVDASATGILVWRILHALGAPLDRATATAIFTSLVTDTGWFRYSNTDAETLHVASELIGLGVEPARLFQRIFQRVAPTEPKALGHVLQRLEYFAGGRLAVVDQPLERDSERALADGDPLLDILRAVEPVEVVLYLREVEPGLCKLSARSKDEFDVNRLARRFGGGGHRKASGATIRGPLDKVRDDLVKATVEMLEQPA